jgi:hypothetical protein
LPKTPQNDPFLGVFPKKGVRSKKVIWVIKGYFLIRFVH